MATLQEFLADIAVDPQKLGQFIHDPDEAMKAAELGVDDQAALRSGFPAMIYARLSGQSPSEAFQVRAVTVVGFKSKK